MNQIISKATFRAVEPQLFVSDVLASCDFFTGRLGFEVAFVYGEPAFYAQVFHDGVRLNLRQVDGPVFDSQFREHENDALAVTITLDNVESLFQEYQAAGILFHQELRSEPWGAQTFIVADPDGNLLSFAS